MLSQLSRLIPLSIYCSLLTGRLAYDAEVADGAGARAYGDYIANADDPCVLFFEFFGVTRQTGSSVQTWIDAFAAEHDWNDWNGNDLMNSRPCCVFYNLCTLFWGSHIHSNTSFFKQGLELQRSRLLLCNGLTPLHKSRLCLLSGNF